MAASLRNSVANLPSVDRTRLGAHQLAMSALCLALLAVCVSGAIGQSGEPLWQTRQRTHTVQQLQANAQRRLCQQTSVNTLKAYFEPLNKQRVVGSPEHKTAGLYIKNTLNAANFTTEWDRFTARTPYGTRTFRNIIATSNSRLTAPRRLVLACHYDSKYFPNEYFVGATDSALPCALLLDLAHTLGPVLHTAAHDDIALQLIFFDGEEAFKQWTDVDSLYGSRNLAEKWQRQWYPSTDRNGRFHLTNELERMDVLMLLDLLGASNPIIRNHQGLGAEKHFESLHIIEENLRSQSCLQQVPKIFHNLDSYQLIEDDHVPFMKRGVPILHMITVPFPRVWHRPEDNADALHWPTIHNLQSVFRVWVASYLQLRV